MIFLALGSNLGNREAFLSQARSVLAMFDVDIIHTSTIIETPALVPENTPSEWNMPYLNQVLEIKTHLSPIELLLCIKHIEGDLGRKPSARWAPREIDIDIIAYGNAVMVEEHLTLPHPFMDQRRFVLEPMAEIAPDWVHPVYGKTVQELLANFNAKEI